MRSLKHALVGTLGTAVAITGLSALPVAPAEANTGGTGLVINEVYGAGGNTGAVYNADFVELYNPTSAAIPLSGLALHYRSGSGSSGGSPFALSGEVKARSTYLVRMSAAGTTGAALPTPDAVASPAFSMAAAGGQVALQEGTAIIATSGSTVGVKGVVDFFGASGAASYEGAPTTAAATALKSLSRTAGADTDNNAADFALTDPTPTPGPATVTPVDASPRADINVNVGAAFPNITLAATGGVTPYSWKATGPPPGVTLATNGQLSGTPTTEGTYPVTATVTDAASPATTDDVSFTITVAPAVELRTIAEVQGEGARSSFAPAEGTALGQTVKVRGVVTAMYKDPAFTASGGFDGMYIQQAGSGGATDTTPNASDAIFVWGSSSMPAGVAVGDSVEVVGRVSEFKQSSDDLPDTLTEITPSSGGVVELPAPLAAPTPVATAYPTTAAGREALEGMLLDPSDSFTVTNVYQANQFGEIGLATGTKPLMQPTEVADDDDAAAVQAVVDDNLARGVVLDDGTAVNYLQNQTNKGQPIPWVTPTNVPRVGAKATIVGNVVLDYRNDAWRFQPTAPVYDAGTHVATFEDTRAQNAQPADVGGDVQIATFNVLNYFNTTGEAYAAAGPQQNPPLDTFCTYYTDRQGNRIGNNSCGVRLLDDPATSRNEAESNDGRGPRGAATTVSLARQEEKLVNAIAQMGADVIGLEEMENSSKLPGETDRDDAVRRIVHLLNQKEGAGTWSFVKSPGEALTASAVAEQDVIRPAFIYRTAKVAPVGQSDILFGTTEFANAREPLAQAFKKVGAPDSDAFAVIVNHFKSKGDNASPAPPAGGDNAYHPHVGAFNGDRTRQARRLVQFADDFAEERGIEAVFLAGDFNAYTMEDPIWELGQGGYTPVESDQPADESYSFSGLSGSLDHVLANAAAHELVTGADIWEINANEPISFQYSRHNYNVTDFWQPNLPFGTSDHNPEIVGLDLPENTEPDYREIQVLGTNDFHGRLLPDAGNAAGAAPFATAVEELRQQYPDSTVFTAAGDLVGASTFESFIQDDNPTIDALNAMGLEVSAAGNHEFDRGYTDFEERIRNRAEWEYIAANLDYAEGTAEADKLAETWTKTFEDGTKVGFVGAVTEDLPALVNPDGIQGISVTDVVEATNAAAADLRADGADLVVLLVHEGAPTTDCSSPSFTDGSTVFGNIAQNTSAEVDAIISGHTHLAYNCKLPVEEWADRAVTRRPVVSAGQYGTNLNQLVFKLDPTTGELAAVTQEIVAAAGVGHQPDPEVQGIVDAAVAHAAAEGNVVLGKMDGAFNRAEYLPLVGGSPKPTENRGGESTLSNQVAEVQRWATAEAGVETDLALMNPGGLRADMVGTVNGEARDLTYRQAADVQPFANTLVNLKLTGAQLEEVLEEQWQRTATGSVPSRPFLRLGVSKGFRYTYVETPETVTAPNSAPVNTFRGEVTGMWLDGKTVDPAATYSVTVNSFLGTGGDNFWTLAEGADKVDTGKVDLEAMVDYMAQFGSDPLPVDHSQRAVEVEFPGNAPAAYAPGDHVTFQVASWAMSGPSDAKDAAVQVRLGDTVIGSAPLDNTIGAQPYDAYGKASVDVVLPPETLGGEQELTLVGATTGTTVTVPLTVERPTTDVQIVGTNDFHGRIVNDPGSASAGAAVLSGAVKQLEAENPNTVFAAAGDLIGASTFESFIQDDEPTIDALNAAGLDVSAAGNHEFDKGYEDLVGRVQDRAAWEYVAANVEEPEGRDDLAETWTQTFGEVEVGFVGAVTEELPALVAPDGIEGLTVTDIVDATNDAAAQLKADGADVVVLLVHEGSPSTSCASPSFTDPSTTWGNITQNTSPDVDAIISGHTHLAYNCEFPVQQWVQDGRAVTKRPVVSAGQYGTNLNKLVFTVDNATGEVQAKSQAILALKSCSNSAACTNYPADAAVTSIVDDAVAEAAVLGNVPLGKLEAPLSRAKYANGVENRGSSSTLGNLVAEAQRWATPAERDAQIGFMNPGGLRGDMVGTVVDQAWLDDPANAEWADDYEIGDRVVSYAQAAAVQSFANSLINMRLTGAQIERVLEQQWQRSSSGAVPTRAFLRLGVSEGFRYTYDEVEDPAIAGARKGIITGMWLHGEPIDPEATYSVTVNSFLAPGGDNFREFAKGTDKVDWGMTDLQSMVEYFAEFGSGAAEIDVKYDQRAVEVGLPDGDRAPAGSSLRLDVAGWSMTGRAGNPPVADPTDDQLQVRLGSQVLGSFPVTTDPGVAGDNNTTRNGAGTATATITLPPGTPAGPAELTLVGPVTGTQVVVPIVVLPTVASTLAPSVSGVAAVGSTLTGSSGGWDPAEVSVAYQWLADGQPIDGATQSTLTLTTAHLGKAISLRVTASAPGHGDGVATSSPTAAVVKATPLVTVTDVRYQPSKDMVVPVWVSAPGVAPTGTVGLYHDGQLLGTGSLGPDGRVGITIPGKVLKPGGAPYTIEARYSGDGQVQPGAGEGQLTKK